jgi:hypothetical protein
MGQPAGDLGQPKTFPSQSALLAARGVLSVFPYGANPLPHEQLPAETMAYGNRTGGVVGGNTNLCAPTCKLTRPAAALGSVREFAETSAETSACDVCGRTTKSFQNSFNGDWKLGRVRSFMYTVPEVEYMLEEFERRNITRRWGGVFMHDDTVTQTAWVQDVADYLQQRAPWLVPIVNQQMGNSGPETLYRSGLFVSSPEQYPIHGCVNGSCAHEFSCTVNGTS